MPFAIDEAHLVSLFSESVFYGLFLATFIACLRAILWNGASFHAAAHVRWALLVVACTMFVVATLDISFNLEHDLNAFIRYKGPGGPSGEFSKISNWINLARGSLFAIQVIIGDGMLIYRTFVVYGNNYWIIAFPVLLWFGVGVGGFAIPVIEASFNDAHVSLTVDRLNVWTNAAVSLTLALNVIGTSLIAFRIWSIARRSRAVVTGGGPAPLEYALRLVVETGLMYTSGIAILLGTSVSKHNAQYIVSDSLVPIIGICFNLLIARASWRANAAAHADSGTAVSYPIRFAAARETKSSGGSSTGSGAGVGDVVRKEKASRPGSPLEVRVAREVACDRPSEECSRATSRSDLESGHLTWAR